MRSVEVVSIFSSLDFWSGCHQYTRIFLEYRIFHVKIPNFYAYLVFFFLGGGDNSLTDKCKY